MHMPMPIWFEMMMTTGIMAMAKKSTGMTEMETPEGMGVQQMKPRKTANFCS